MQLLIARPLIFPRLRTLIVNRMSGWVPCPATIDVEKYLRKQRKLLQEASNLRGSFNFVSYGSLMWTQYRDVRGWSHIPTASVRAWWKAETTPDPIDSNYRFPQFCMSE